MWAILSGLLLVHLSDLQSENTVLKGQTGGYQNQICQLENQIDEMENQTSKLENQITELEKQLEEQIYQKMVEDGVIKIIDVERGWYSGSWGAGAIDIEVSVKNYGRSNVDGLVLELGNTYAGTVEDTKAVGLLQAGKTKTITLRGGYSFVTGGPNFVELSLNGNVLDSESF